MGCKKPRKLRKGRASEQDITRRGLHIYQKGDQIKYLGGNRWDVTSQSTEDTRYRVSFAGKSPMCECTHHTTGKGCRCKHIAAVEHTLFISSEAALGKKVDIKKQHMVCPHCKKEESLTFRIVILHYNYIKPHNGIAYRTPAETAGIDIQSTDKWLTLIQNAVSTA